MIVSLFELSTVILFSSEINFKGRIKYDNTKLTGQKQRIMDSSKMTKIGWVPKTNLSNGIKKTVSWFIKNRSSIREK